MSSGIRIVSIACTLLVAAAAVWLVSRRVDTFVLVDAALVDPRFSTSPAQMRNRGTPMALRPFAVRAHRLRHGQGTIYGYRAFDRGEWLAIDDETYRKLTLWTVDPIPEHETRWRLGDDRRIVAIYTRGGSAWPGRACTGRMTQGTLRVRPRWRGVRVEVHGRIDAPCADREIAVSFDASPLDFDALTPWLGLPAEHPYAETYR